MALSLTESFNDHVSFYSRHGRTIGSCHNMECDVIDSQLRNLESIFEVVENFVTTIYNSVAGSLPFRK